MQAHVLLVGLILSATALSQERVAASVFILLWTALLAFVLRRARTWSDE